MKRYRVAVLGLNHYHVTGWVESLDALSDRVEVVALYDPDPKRGARLKPDHADPNLSQEFPAWSREIPFETSLDRVLDIHKPDIALVTLPNVDAPEAIIRCAGAGTHVLADKPAARTATEAERAFEAARSAGIKVAIALTRRYGQAWRDAATLFTGGRLGRLLSTEAVFATSSVAVRDPANLIFDREAMGGGVLHWLGVHDLDLLHWLSGQRIEEVQAMAATVGDPSIDVEDVISVSLRYASGAIGTAHFAYALPRSGGDGYVAVRGSEGSLKIEPSGAWSFIGGGSLLEPVTEQRATYASRLSTGYGAVGTVIIDDLLRAIEEDRDPLATDHHVLAALRVIDAIYRAADTGQRVRVDYKGDHTSWSSI